MVDFRQLLTEVVRAAKGYIGRGEQGENNAGPFIEFLGGRRGTRPAWCALLAGKCYRDAYERLDPGGLVPQWLFRAPGVPEPGALRLVHGLSMYGRSFRDPAQLRPGDLVLWNRVGGHHVGVFIEHDQEQPELINTIEGNVGRYPARVRKLSHDVLHDVMFVEFASVFKEPP